MTKKLIVSTVPSSGKTLLPPATKLRQGNVFTPLSHSVHGEGVSVPACITGHITGGGGLSGGQSLSRGISVRGSAWGVSVWEGPCPGGLCPGGLCPGGLCPGRSLSGGLCLGESLFRGISVKRGLCLGGSLCREDLC